MSKKKNQHTVPKFYFRYFSLDQKTISLLNLKTGKIVKKAPIKSQCSKNYYYGDKQVEDAIEQLENVYRTSLNKLKKSLDFRKILEDDYIFILQGILFQRSRTVAIRERKKGAQDKMARLQMEVEINNNNSLSEEEKKEHLSYLDYIAANPKVYQGIGMIESIRAVEHIVDLFPILLFNRTKFPFIFGDAPVVFYNSHQRDVKLRGVLGLKTPGIQIFYPISSDTALLLIDPAEYKISGINNYNIELYSPKDICQINKLQIHNAISTIYFSDFKHAEYVKKLWTEEKEHLRKTEDKYFEAPGFDQTGNPIGDIVHVFEPQIPYYLELSFIDFNVVGDGEYKSARKYE